EEVLAGPRIEGRQRRPQRAFEGSTCALDDLLESLADTRHVEELPRVLKAPPRAERPRQTRDRRDRERNPGGCAGPAQPFPVVGLVAVVPLRERTDEAPDC